MKPQQNSPKGVHSVRFCSLTMCKRRISADTNENNSGMIRMNSPEPVARVKMIPSSQNKAVAPTTEENRASPVF